MGAEGVAGGGAARDEEAADGVGVHHAATELDGHEAHRVAEVELDEGVDGRGAVRPAVDEHVDAEEAAVDAADGVAEGVGDGRAEAVEKGAAEDVGQLPSEPVGVSESGAGEGSAGVRVEDGEAGVGDATVAVAVKLQGEVCRFVQLGFDADHPPSTEGTLDPTPLWISDRSVFEGENPATGAGEGGLEHKGCLTSRHVIDHLTHRRAEAGHGNGRQLGQPTEHAFQATSGGLPVGERTEGVTPRRDEDRGATSAEAFEGGEDVGRESPRRGEERPLDVRRQPTERISSQQSNVRAQKKRERIKELIRPLGVGYPNAVAAIGVPKWEGFEVVRHPARGGVGGIVGLADPDSRLVSRIETVQAPTRGSHRWLRSS